MTGLKELILKHLSYTPTSGQKELIQRLDLFIREKDNNIVFLLKGYAGTGKTTVISALINALEELETKTVLLAPTGRAAKVLSNYSGKKAYTIHKKIYTINVSKDGNSFIGLRKNIHNNYVFIIDEASMINNSKVNSENLFGGRDLLEDIFEFVYSAKNCRLILTGDTAQLPPVKCDSSPALDEDYLKATFHHKITGFQLTEVVRQSLESGILTNATYIRQHLRNQKYNPPFLKLGSFADILNIDGRELEDAINESYSKAGIEDSIIICRSNKMANKFNEQIRKRILYRENEVQAGDLMMVVKNNYFWLDKNSDAGFIANGDIIEVLKLKKIQELYGFRFADVSIRLIDYPDEKDMDVKILLDTIYSESPNLEYNKERELFSEIMKDYEELPVRSRYKKVKNNPFLNALQVKFSYALTCHKTQGGQWNTVFINNSYLPDNTADAEYLRWLYTALTRATRKTYLVNFPEEFFKAD